MTQKPNINLENPWLVAAWPGMGSVGALAIGHLVNALGAKPMGSIPPGDFFEVDHVEVSQGIARTGRLPRNLFFAWKDPSKRQDLILFVGESQPEKGGYALCRRIMKGAVARGVKRVVTFGAMGTQIHPTGHPHVFGAVTAPEMLGELRKSGAELLRDGNVGGLNGSLLAAASEHGIAGMCLLGEMPFFAAGIPNPRASLAVLELFSNMSKVDIDLSDLDARAEIAQTQLQQLLEQLQAGANQIRPIGDDATPDFVTEDDMNNKTSPEQTLDRDAKRQIEDLFEAANDDRNRATELKAELDRHGVFKKYENRFLDLFKRS